MKLIKISKIIMLSVCAGSTISYAEEKVSSLPTIKVMADTELRDESGVITPYQEDKKLKKTLQHHIDKTNNDIQNHVINESINTTVYQPVAAVPDMSKLTTAEQQYVLAVASGLQSNDPSSGLFSILGQLGINRSNVDDYRNGTIKINPDQSALLQKLKDNSWQMK